MQLQRGLLNFLILILFLLSETGRMMIFQP